jgi:gas vesicle protein
MLIFWNKVRDFFKKYWGYIAMFVGGAIAVLAFKKKSEPDDTKTIRDSYDSQLDLSNQVRHEENRKEDEAKKKLDDGLTHVEKQYSEKKKNLDDNKKQEIKTILQQHQDDPVGLAEKLSKVTGFKVIMPEK